MNRFCTSLLAPLAWVFFASPSFVAAEEPVAAPPVERPVATPAAIEKWIEQLDSRDFQVRNQATEKLVAAGLPAIDATARAAAESKSLEVVSRCISVLGKLHSSEESSLKKAATAALEQLAQSDNPAAARRAAQLVKKEEEPQPQPNPFGIRINQVQIIQGGRVRIQNNNGDRTIEAEEDGKKIKIQQDAQGKIKMSVTEKVDGKEKTSEYQAENEAELKKKHPDAHKLFEKYGKQGNGALQAVGRIQIQAIPGRLLPRNIQPGAFPNKQGLQKLSEAQRELHAATGDLNKLAEKGASPEELKQVAKRLEAAVKKLQEAQKQLVP